MWNHMFALNLPVAEKLLRAVIVYAFLVIIMRVFGKPRPQEPKHNEVMKRLDEVYGRLDDLRKLVSER